MTKPLQIYLEYVERIEFPGAMHHESAIGWITILQDHPISYTDAVSFAVMTSSGCTAALSHDHHFVLAVLPLSL